MSTSTTQITDAPTRAQYQCGSGCGTITFSWGRRMPKNGRLGTVTIGQFVNKPIQVFAAKPIAGGGTAWRFQAQDGSFLGHLLVSQLKSFIRFVDFRPGDQFPLVFCVAPRPDAGDPRDPIERYTR
ncbi:MAG TPA: hypothetical protein VFX96_17135 [Pyrinomonadaceae bacterium]|nr:hypothetical protein [Pyrinomonadaceae bacterium]